MIEFPYIKQERRPFYNNIVQRLLKLEGVSEVPNIGDELVTHVTLAELEFQDGDLNYFITKLLKTINLESEDAFHISFSIVEFLINILLRIYTSPKEGYFNYNRLLGMLTACMKEYERRYGKDKVNSLLLFQNIIERVYVIIGKYEDKKIIENGDV